MIFTVFYNQYNVFFLGESDQIDPVSIELNTIILIVPSYKFACFIAIYLVQV